MKDFTCETGLVANLIITNLPVPKVNYLMRLDSTWTLKVLGFKEVFGRLPS